VLIYLSLALSPVVDGYTTEVYNTRPVLRQTTVPSQSWASLPIGWYQIILLVTGAQYANFSRVVTQPCPTRSRLHKSQVWRHSRCATRPPPRNIGRLKNKRSSCRSTTVWKPVKSQRHNSRPYQTGCISPAPQDNIVCDVGTLLWMPSHLHQWFIQRHHSQITWLTPIERYTQHNRQF